MIGSSAFTQYRQLGRYATSSYLLEQHFRTSEGGGESREFQREEPKQLEPAPTGRLLAFLRRPVGDGSTCPK